MRDKQVTFITVSGMKRLCIMVFICCVPLMLFLPFPDSLLSLFLSHFFLFSLCSSSLFLLERIYTEDYSIIKTPLIRALASNKSQAAFLCSTDATTQDG
ncbi:hypothetical protein BCR43DRAFT_333031 [Syncephalastrum racemosum]|uniref:Uncharacterized protein n=1 Tax=Syncephalastrum racemosum TaxID=13706 RepID=A0A1X2H898_SYNRA|nr:hypothetical protein BCR43DRAFT_333031 [Syncephalastrum racemosum]